MILLRNLYDAADYPQPYPSLDAAFLRKRAATAALGRFMSGYIRGAPRVPCDLGKPTTTGRACSYREKRIEFSSLFGRLNPCSLGKIVTPSIFWLFIIKLHAIQPTTGSSI
jgi:hypothetical protein